MSRGVVLYLAAYYGSELNPQQSRLLAAVDTLTSDKDRDVQYFISRRP